jgi:hypothetical protein
MEMGLLDNAVLVARVADIAEVRRGLYSSLVYSSRYSVACYWSGGAVTPHGINLLMSDARFERSILRGDFGC